MADTVRAAVVQLLADEDSARNIARAGELVEAAAESPLPVVAWTPADWRLGVGLCWMMKL